MSVNKAISAISNQILYRFNANVMTASVRIDAVFPCE